MSEADQHAARRRLSRCVWINAPVLFCVLAAAAVGVAAYNYSLSYYAMVRTRAVAQAEETLRRVVMDVSQVFYSYDSILKTAIALLGDAAIAALPAPTKDRLVARMVEQFPYVASVVILDTNGAVQLSSAGADTRDETYEQTDFFKEQINGALVGPYLSLTTAAPTIARWQERPAYQIAISRRITYGGQFKGVAVVFIRLSDFRDQFTNINVGEGNMIALIHDGNRYLTRRPSRDGQGDFGVALLPEQKARIARASEGTFITRSPMDGRVRLFAVENVPDWPLDLVFGVPVSVVDGAWERRMTLVGSGAGLAALALLFAGGRLRRERLRRLAAEAALEHLSVTDFLTGLANRRRFDEVVQREFRRARRTGSWLSLAIIDADSFKALNDHHGHTAGDETLKLIAATITENLRRPSDLAARLGGEEFALLLPDTPASGAFEIVERIRRAMEARTGCADGPPATTVSAGIACTKDRPPPDSAASLIEAADRALYRAKHKGRNRTELAAAGPPASDDGADAAPTSESRMR